MAKGYPQEFRQRVVDLVDAGRRIAEIAAELGISEQSILHVAASSTHRCRY